MIKDETFSIIHRKPYFFDPHWITGTNEKVRWEKKRNRTTKESRWEKRKVTGNKDTVADKYYILIMYILRSISVWCTSQAILQFPAPQTGLFWWMTHQSITPVTEKAHLTKALLCHRRSTETVSNLLQADPPHTRNTHKKPHFSTLSLCIPISMYTVAIVSTRCVW